MARTDIEKAMAAKKPPRCRTKPIVLAVIATLVVLGAVAALGRLFLAHGSAALPHSAAAVQSVGGLSAG